MNYFSSIDADMVMKSSGLILSMVSRELTGRLSATFGSFASFSVILETLPACDDSPKLRHWLSTSAVLLRSRIKNLDPEPRFVNHFHIDSLRAERILELHLIRALEIVTEHHLKSNAEFFWEDPGLQCPAEFNVWSLGTLQIPRSRGIRIQLRKTEAIIEFGDARTVFRRNDVGHPPVCTGNCAFTPTYFFQTDYGSTAIPLNVAGIADAYHSHAPIIRDMQTNLEWLNTFGQAVEIIAAQNPETARQCLRLAPAVLALHAGGTGYGSSSPQEVLGLIFLPGVLDPHDVAECLVHEALHQKLFRVEDGAPLFHEEKGDIEIYYSPWRSDARPLRMLTHGAFVFTGVAHHWQAVKQSSADQGLQSDADFHTYYRARQAQLAMDIVERYDYRTAMGCTISRVIRDGIEDAMSRCQTAKSLRREAESRLLEHQNRFGHFVR